MKRMHPAMVLYEKLFAQECLSENPINPSCYVPRAVFHDQCKKAGISVPENIIDAMEWEEKLGLTEFVHKLIKEHHNKNGTDFTPMEKGAWRLRQKQKRLITK